MKRSVKDMLELKSAAQHDAGQHTQRAWKPHLGHVPPTKRSARNVPAATEYSCSMACSCRKPAQSKSAKISCA